MEKNSFGSTMEVDENTGLQVLCFCPMISGLSICPEDLGDPDRMAEINKE